MPQQLGNGALRYSADEAQEMFARGEVRWISPEESAERLRLAGMPAGAPIRHAVDDIREKRPKGWSEPDPAELREKAAKASKARARERRARLAAVGGGR